jgi:hypothetical protein
VLHRISTHGETSKPHPSADGARGAQLNIEYQKARKADVNSWQNEIWLSASPWQFEGF